MTQRIFKTVCVLSVILFSNLSFSADEASDDLSLDNEFNQEVPSADSTQSMDSMDLDATNVQSESLVTPNPLDEMTSEPAVDTNFSANQDFDLSTETNNDDQSENVNLASPIELRQKTNALFGFSVGMMISSQPFNLKYRVDRAGFDKISNDKKTGEFQNVGVMGRYAIAPFYGIGTDLNISYMQTQNHQSIYYEDSRGEVFSQITTLRAELNLTYAIEVADKVPVYFLLGFGAQKVNSDQIETLIKPMGYGGQIGAGFVINSTFNIEGVYSYYEHRISQKIVEDNAKRGSVANPVTIDTEKAKVVNQGLLVRGTYSFNY